MASFSQLNQFPCRILLEKTPSNAKFSSLTPSIIPLSSNKTNPTRNNSILKSRIMVKRELTKTRPVFLVKAVDEDEEEVTQNEPLEIDSLKRKLVDSFRGTDHGLKATCETRAEIVELIAELEARNPNPAPTEALTLLDGKWILASTSFAGLFPMLWVTLPLVNVEEISQTIDSKNFTVQNNVQFSGPLATTSISAYAKFEVRSPKRMQIKFEQGIFGAPKLTENVEFMGHKADVTLFRAIVSSVEDTASSVAKIISSHLPAMFSISDSNAESWLLTTYLDDDLRISRGDAADSVFVLIKEGSSLLTPEQT